MAAPSPQIVLFRCAIGLYIVCIFSLVASYFAVSTMDLETSLYLQAPSYLEADGSNASRGIVLNAQTGRLYIDAKTTFMIGPDKVGEAETESHGHLHAQLRPPKKLTGPQKLKVGVVHPLIEDFEIAVDVRVHDVPEPFVWPSSTSRLVDEKKSVDAAWEGDLKVLVIPPDGEIPRGLPSIAYLLLVDAETDAPVDGTISVDKIEGMVETTLPTEIHTDVFGLAKLRLTATTSLRLTLTARAPTEEGERSGTGTVRLNTVPSQFSLVPKQRIAVPGQSIHAYISTLHRSGGVLVDLYDGEQWVAADAFGVGPDGAGVRALVPEDVRGPLIRLQVYQDLFDASVAWDSRWLVVVPSATGGACLDALRVVLDLHAAHSARYAKWAAATRAMPQLSGDGRRCDSWLEAALLAVPTHFVPAPLLVNTQVGDREELEGWRRATQQKLMFATAGVLLVGFAFMLLLVLQGVGRHQEHARTLRELELETATADELEVPAARIDIARWVFVVQTVIIVLTIFTFGVSLLMLLSWM